MKILITFFIALLSFSVSADQWTPELGQKIAIINPGVFDSKSAFITLKETSFSGCPRTDGAVLVDTNSSFSEIYSLLLAARVSDKLVRVYYGGCLNDFPVIKQAYILEE